MSDKFSFRGGDPEGVPDGDYVLTVADDHVTGLSPVGPGGGLTVQDESGNVATGVTQLDFQGAGVTAADGTGEVVVTIPGGGGGGGGGNPYDDPTQWTTSLGYDEEFATTGTSLPSGWSWANQGTSTWRQEFGAGVLTPQKAAVATAQNLRMVSRALPAESTWTATAKVTAPPVGPSGSTSEYHYAGLALYDTAGVFLLHAAIANASAGQWQLARWSNSTTFAAGYRTVTAPVPGVYYSRIKKTGATTYDFLVSPDGIAWTPIALGVNVSGVLTPASIGLVASGGANSPGFEASIHWFRVR